MVYQRYINFHCEKANCKKQLTASNIKLTEISLHIRNDQTIIL